MTLPRTASIVIVGGGVVGCSSAYHPAGRGVRDVVVLERGTVGSGTTSKAAGGIRAQFPTETEIRFSLEAINAFEGFEDEFGVDIGYKKIGYLFLVSDPADLRGFEPRIALQRRLGVDVRVIAPADAKKLVPALRVDDLIAAVWGPGDGLAGPAEGTNGFAKRARQRGGTIAEGGRVTAVARAGEPGSAVPTGPRSRRRSRRPSLACPSSSRRRSPAAGRACVRSRPTTTPSSAGHPACRASSSPWASAATASSTRPPPGDTSRTGS